MDFSMDTLSFYLLHSSMLFSIGVFGVCVRKNVIVILMCIELMLNAVNLSFVALSYEYGNLDGQIYVVFIMAVAAAEAAVGLAIVISVFRNFYTVQTDNVSRLSG